MSGEIEALEVRRDLLARREIVFFDLREEDAYAKNHPLFAANLPLSRLELEIVDRVGRLDVRIVVYDDGDGLVHAAVTRLKALGYTDVLGLKGGLDGWRRAGLELFQDVNSASKAFGELVEARRETPSLAAHEAKALIDDEPNLVVLDARRWDEYQTMSIPRGVSAPGAELVLRAEAIAPDPSTTIIVNCAGRTRSIIGAQSLVSAGLPNPVFALRNGAIGWTLAGFPLDHGQTRTAPDPSQAETTAAKKRARAVAYRAGVKWVTLEDLDHLSRDPSRTLYRFDVRTPAEYAAGHISGFRSAPGGQLVQETDVFAPVRGARVILADDIGVRADMSASWLAQMGWEVYVLEGGFNQVLQKGPWRPSSPTLPLVSTIGVEDLSHRLSVGQIAVVDLAPSPIHRRGHIPGARFAIRAQLASVGKTLHEAGVVVLTSPDGALATLAAADLALAFKEPPVVLDGGTAAWISAGSPLETGMIRPLNLPTDVYKRPYEGTDNGADAMQAYLDWEFGLVDQLERDGTHGFFVI